MDRRDIFGSSAFIPAATALAGLPRLAAADIPGRWRVFEVTTTAEILKSAPGLRPKSPLTLSASLAPST